jgi:hypothetical protein
MQPEQHDLGVHDSASVWRDAQHRRTEELYDWLVHFLHKRRLLRSAVGRFQSRGRNRASENLLGVHTVLKHR